MTTSLGDSTSDFGVFSLSLELDSPQFFAASRKLRELFLQFVTHADTGRLLDRVIKQCVTEVQTSRATDAPENSPRPADTLGNATPPMQQQQQQQQQRASLKGAVDEQGAGALLSMESSPPQSHHSSPTTSARGHGGKHWETDVSVSRNQGPSVVEEIPRFFFPKPKNAGVPPLVLKNNAQKVFNLHDGALEEHTFMSITRTACKLPSYLNSTLFRRVQQVSQGRVDFPAFMRFFEQNLKDRPVAEQVFNILKKPRNSFIERDDLVVLLDETLERHPGLEFLKATPEFQERYTETVIERVFYDCDRKGDGRLLLQFFQRSNFVDVLRRLDEEDDINQITDFFSYEHFYVLYCKFWELDSDHDFMITKEEFSRYGNYSLTNRVVSRIFEQVPRKFMCEEPGMMGYKDFCWFCISEEDKRTRVALDYWFKVLDIDRDGILSGFELEYFYAEQMQRLESVAAEVVTFEDILCQM